MAKSKEEAIALYNQAVALENTDTTGDHSAEIITLLNLAANTCPHEPASQERRIELDVPGVETYECMDCHFLNYVEV